MGRAVWVLRRTAIDNENGSLLIVEFTSQDPAAPDGGLTPPMFMPVYSHTIIDPTDEDLRGYQRGSKFLITVSPATSGE